MDSIGWRQASGSAFLDSDALLQRASSLRSRQDDHSIYSRLLFALERRLPFAQAQNNVGSYRTERGLPPLQAI
jgi:hypothetical protein